MNKGLNFLFFFIIGIFILLDFNGFKFLKHLKESMEVRIFLNEEICPDSLREEIEKKEGIDRLIFISKDHALREFQKEFEAYSVPEENPLPASFRIILNPKYENPQYLSYLSSSLEAITGVKKLVYGEEYIQNIYTISKYFTWISIGMSGLLFFLILFSIITTLNQRALILRNETSLLKSFGISHWRLKIKLSFRAFFENLILSGVAIGLLYCVYRFLLAGTLYAIQLPLSTFLPISFILGFIGGLSILTLIISLIKKI